MQNRVVGVTLLVFAFLFVVAGFFVGSSSEQIEASDQVVHHKIPAQEYVTVAVYEPLPRWGDVAVIEASVGKRDSVVMVDIGDRCVALFPSQVIALGNAIPRFVDSMSVALKKVGSKKAYGVDGGGVYE